MLAPAPTQTSAPVAATILAAGLGRRLGGRPKAALQIGGLSLLERLSGALRAAGIEQIRIVLGPYPETLLPLAQRCGLQVLSHGQPETGLIDSQRLAIQVHLAQGLAQGQPQDLLLVLADLPWLRADHVRALLGHWQQRAAGIEAQMPLVAGLRGHPVLLSWQAVGQIDALSPDAGIRDWLKDHPGLVRPFISHQPAYITDLDTPADLTALEQAMQPEPVRWPAPWDQP
jgi:CTP:molybdopterin cytidylyltransferase MocA